MAGSHRHYFVLKSLTIVSQEERAEVLAEVQRLKAEASRMVTKPSLLTFVVLCVLQSGDFGRDFDFVLFFICIMKVAILAMEAEEENFSEEKKLSLGQEVRFLYNLQNCSFQGV